MAKYERKLQRFGCAGVNLTLPADLIPPEKYARLKNVRVRQQGVIESRDGIAATDATALDQTNVHSIRRLNDPSPGAAPVWTRIIGAGTKLYSGQGPYTVRDTGYSGDPLSLVPYRPERSPQAWMYVADRLKMRKVRADGTDYAMGVAPPLAAPGAEIAAPTYTTISDCEAAAGWAQGGTAGAPSAAARVAATITRILYDAGNTGWACIQPSATDEGIQVGMFLIVNTGGGTAETIVIQEVHNAITSTTIGSIAYDSGATGLCTIQPVTLTKGLARNSMLLLGAGGTQEAVRVLSVTEGPDGLASFRCSTVNTQAAGGAIAGLASFRAYCANTHAAAEHLDTNYVTSSITVGLGTLTAAGALNLSKIGARPTQDEDEIHISISVDKPELVAEGKVLLDCDSATNDFTQNYFFHAFRASDLTPATKDSLTVSTTRERAVQREIIDQQRQEEILAEVPDQFREQVRQQLEKANLMPVSEQSITGASQWTELRFKVRELTRVGSDGTRGLANIASIRVSLSVTGTTALKIDAWWVGGGYGPDIGASLGKPYQYRYRYRSKLTGAKSLPSPITRYGLEPRRQRVSLASAASADPQVDTVDFERWGGAWNEWHYLGSTTNGGSLSDDYADGAIMANQALETDAYQPFPVVDLPKSGTCNVAGTSVTWASGDAFSTSWARGTQIKIDGVPYELYAQPASTIRLETFQNVGTKTGVSWIVEEPLLLGQPLPVIWGPTPDEGMFFGVGDDRNSGTIYATKGGDPDSAPDTHQKEVTSPSEPLMNGCMFDAKSIAFSSERAFWCRINPQGVNVIEAQELPVGRGLWCRWGLAVGPKIWFIVKDGICETAGGEAVSITDPDLYPLFPHEGVAGVATNGYQPPNMADTANLRLSFYDGFLFFDYMDMAGARQTLVYDTKVKGWFPDTYAPGVICHHGEEGKDIHSLLLGAVDGRIYQPSGTSDAGSAIACQVRPGSFDGGDRRATNQWGDLMVDLDSGGVNVSAQPGFDEFQTTLAATIVNTAARDVQPIDLNAGVGQRANNIGVDFTWSAVTRVRLYAWEPSWLDKPEDTLLRATDWIELPDVMFLQGLHIIADTSGVVRTVKVQYDSPAGPVDGATITINHNGETKESYTFTPFIAHRIRLLPTDAGSWRLLAIEPIGEPSPDAATLWYTQPTTHDLPGYQHLGPIGYIAHMATADITLTVKVEGTSFVYTIAHNAGVYKKSPVPFEPMKGKSYEYIFTSPAAFRLFKRDCEVRVKAWGDSGGYAVANPFGDLSRESGARV